MIQNDIRKAFLKNSIIAWSCVAITMLSLVLCFFTMSKAVDESRKYLYMVRTDGEVVPLEWVNRRENIGVEMKHHITMFVENFYSLNQFNWERKIEKALWLGDFEQLHRNRSNKGYYNRFIQFGYIQDAILYPENIELAQQDNKFLFRIIINLTETIDKKKYQYSILCKGTIDISDRNFPHNPHGMFITNYVEETIIQEE